MCGLAGVVLADREGRVERAWLEAMAAALAHRGPDGEAIWVAPGVGLASRRLAVIDPAGGGQPLANEDGSIVCVYNGEIYNFAGLRAELERAGHRFRSRTDGEVLCHLYEAEGDAMLARLRGMFAFALWDAQRGRLLLARDRFGVKPLYHARIPGGLAFASELKALQRLPGLGRDLDPVALSDYLTYLYVPAPRTILAAASKLEPGSLLGFQHGRLEQTRWWQPPPPGEGAPLTLEEAAAELRERLRETVRAHMVADVPVGAFLSGGLDSSTIVALMAEASPHPVKTFTVGFHNAGSYDERAAAKTVANHFDCHHHETTLGPAETSRLLPACAWQLDEPLGDATALASFALAREARRQVAVVLTGIGGDELFAGYRRYQAERLIRAAGPLGSPPLAHAVSLLMAHLPASGRSRAQDLVRLARKFLAETDAPLERRYLAWNAAFTASEKADLLTSPDGVDSLAWGERFFRAFPHGPFVARAQLVDLQTYLPHDPLAVADATTMAWGLEARVPLCDSELAGWALNLPLGARVRGLQGKVALRQAMAGLLPASILRRGKRGFSVPTDLWLRGPLADDVKSLLAPERLQPAGLFKPEAVARLLAEHASGRRDRSQHLWALLMFQAWYRLFSDTSAPDRLQELI
ncbi:asparagine synthase (glutamine-hydrolyzing) [Gaiella occulta]|uniref:asparagine synthase (glutamine-hydrolyzing) n=1 Tax=Gaiella occulta TaxID=1002870 RepID=A0A7M2Z2L6_9ACTN|nr:asparagine synthase (glutamine-hydrolyzing) [Gaiella occulta]RDI76252.1 asparagine synthase (glutamine-hydrolyzing) [Gaiella occulta]